MRKESRCCLVELISPEKYGEWRFRGAIVWWLLEVKGRGRRGPPGPVGGERRKGER